MKEKDTYSPRDAAIAVLEKVKELAQLAKSEHDKKNLKEMKDSVDKFIGEEAMEKADMGMPKGAPKPAASSGVGASSMPSVPKAPAISKPPKPMMKFLASRAEKMGNGGPEPKTRI